MPRRPSRWPVYILGRMRWWTCDVRWGKNPRNRKMLSGWTGQMKASYNEFCRMSRPTSVPVQFFRGLRMMGAPGYHATISKKEGEKSNHLSKPQEKTNKDTKPCQKLFLKKKHVMFCMSSMLRRFLVGASGATGVLRDCGFHVRKHPDQNHLCFICSAAAKQPQPECSDILWRLT